MKTRALFGVAALLVAGPVLAQQTYRCVDKAGRSYFTDKAVEGCKPVARRGGTATAITPAVRPPTGGNDDKKREVAAAVSPERQRELQASRCKTYKEELEWLNSPAGKGAQNHGARVSQVTRAMRGCS